jgi:hypothetical protein
MNLNGPSVVCHPPKFCGVEFYAKTLTKQTIPMLLFLLVMNNTCIHLKFRGSYIYTCTGGEYTKNPLEKYNNRKVNTYLIPAQTHYGSTTLSLER